MKKLPALASLVLSAGLALAGADAKGTLGERYASLSYVYAKSNDVNGHGAAAHLNLPMHLAADGWGIDLGLEGGFLSVDHDTVDADGRVAMAGGTIFSKTFGGEGATTSRYRFYASLAAGRSKAEVFGFGENSWVFGGTVGVEFQLSDTFTLKPYVQYFEYEKYNTGEEAIGFEASVWLNDKDNLLLGMTHVSSEGTSVNAYRIGYRRGF